MAKKSDTREKIMKEALKLFSEQGYYSTTTKQIADKACINEITLFRHFGTKEKLFQDTTLNYVKHINIKGKIEQLKHQGFKENIIEIAKDLLQLYQDNKRLYKIQMRLSDKEKDFVKLKLSREFASALEEYFIELLDKGEINGEPHMMAVTFINSILGAFTVYVLSNKSFTELSIEEIVDEQAKQFAEYYTKF